jgi:hypothetical protein
MNNPSIGQRARVRTAATLGFPSWLKLPLVGDVDNKFRAPEAVVNDPRFGQSEGVPFVMEIAVDGERSIPAGVGQKVDNVFFKEAPKLLFNVSFACGKPKGLCRTGIYGDPRSIWFNVFFGYYQIDVSARAWGRPFGYEADGVTVCWDDVLRIGKSDWNYFSNWLYGVPDQAIDSVNMPLRAADTSTTHHGRRPINGNTWDVIEIDNAHVVSAYDNGQGPELVQRELWSTLWQASYGFPLKKRVVEEQSFFPVPMKANLYMAWRKVDDDNDLGEPAYQTFLFGGTINKWWSAKSAQHAADNEEFLKVQLAAVEKVMRTYYPDLGFQP